MMLTNRVKSATMIAAAGVLALALAPAGAFAATATTTFQVSATVSATCSISANPLSFGAYTGAQANAQAALSVYCTNGTTYNVGLNAGTTSGANINNRMMTNGTNTLNYALYSDASRSLNWGNSDGSWVPGTGSGVAQTVNVYGQIPANQALYTGTYTDTITATVNY